MKYNKRNKRTRRRRRRRKGGDFPGQKTKERWTEGANSLMDLGSQAGDVGKAMGMETMRIGKEANEERKKNEAINEQKYTKKEEVAEQTAGKKRRKSRRKTHRKKRFRKHYMWNKKGKRYRVKTYKQHLRGVKLGHTHKKPKKTKKRRRRK